VARNLILYYSRNGENYVNGNIVSLEKGNTKICAEFIQKAVGGTLFEINTVSSYPKDYHACTKQALDEFKKKARPQLQQYLDNLDGYDNIFVCGPCWWGTFPMAVFSLLERLDFKGKKVMCLMTHEGSGLGQSERDLKRVCIGALFGSSIAIHVADAKLATQVISKWALDNLKEGAY